MYAILNSVASTADQKPATFADGESPAGTTSLLPGLLIIAPFPPKCSGHRDDDLRIRGQYRHFLPRRFAAPPQRFCRHRAPGRFSRLSGKTVLGKLAGRLFWALGDSPGFLALSWMKCSSASAEPQIGKLSPEFLVCRGRERTGGIGRLDRGAGESSPGGRLSSAGTTPGCRNKGVSSFLSEARTNAMAATAGAGRPGEPVLRAVRVQPARGRLEVQAHLHGAHVGMHAMPCPIIGLAVLVQRLVWATLRVPRSE